MTVNCVSQPNKVISKCIGFFLDNFRNQFNGKKGNNLEWVCVFWHFTKQNSVEKFAFFLYEN